MGSECQSGLDVAHVQHRKKTGGKKENPLQRCDIGKGSGIASAGVRRLRWRKPLRMVLHLLSKIVKGNFWDLHIFCVGGDIEYVRSTP